MPRSTSAGSQALSASSAPTQRGDVHVVAAGVADPRGAGGEVEAGALAHGQGVHVGAQGDAVLGVGRTDVGEQAGPGQQAHPDARGIEAAGHGLGRAHLFAGQLGMGMEVPPDVDELCCE